MTAKKGLSELSSMKATIAGLQQEVRTKESEMKALTTAKGSTNSQVRQDAVAPQVSELKQTVSQLQNLVDDMKQQASLGVEALKVSQAEVLREKDASLRSQKDSLKMVNAAIEDKDTAVHGLETRLKNSNDAYAKLQTELNNEDDKSKAAKQDLALMTQKFQTSEAGGKDMEVKFHAIQQALEEKVDVIQKDLIEEKLKSQRLQGKILQGETNQGREIVEKIAGLESAHASAMKTLKDKHEAEIRELRATHGTERERQTGAGERFKATHAKEIDELKAAHEKEIDELKAAHEQEIADLKKAHDDEMNEVITELEDGNTEVIAKLRQDHKEKMEKSRVVFQLIRAQNEGAMEKIKALQKQVTELQAKIAAVQESSNRLDYDTTRLHAGAITQKDKEIDDLTQKLNTAKRQINNLETQLTQATTGLTDAVEGGTELSTEIEELKRKIADLKSTYLADTNGYLADTRVALCVHHVYATLLVAEFQSIMNRVGVDAVKADEDLRLKLSSFVKQQIKMQHEVGEYVTSGDECTIGKLPALIDKVKKNGRECFDRVQTFILEDGHDLGEIDPRIDHFLTQALISNRSGAVKPTQLCATECGCERMEQNATPCIGFYALTE
ncbi:hypothetical protein T484DRAFT_3641829, partial [Baffinella frigidus]